MDQKFEKIARKIMCGMTLFAGDNKYRICEIEFYLYNGEHEDVFVHRHPLQKTKMQWYFHHTCDKEHSYKSGTYKGLDITCGDNESYGGILIRSIYNEDKKEMIEGPCKIVDEIIEQTKYKDIKDLVVNGLNNNLSVFSNNIFRLQNSSSIRVPIFTSPRIGLTLKKKDNLDLRKQYIAKLYRYVIYPSYSKKYKKLTLISSLFANKNYDYLAEHFNISSSSISKLDFPLISHYPSLSSSYDSYLSRDLKDQDRLDLYYISSINI